MRNIEHPHLKDDEFDLIDMIKIEGYFFYIYIHLFITLKFNYMLNSMYYLCI